MQRFGLLAGFNLFLMLALANTGSALSIDFEADGPLGNVANGFTSLDSSQVHFSDSNGSDLFVLFAGTGGDGAASLITLTDNDGSFLEIALDFIADFLSLDFGSDNPNFTNAGDLAVLTAFNGAVQVGQVTLALNRDNLMNQSISIGSMGGGLLFDGLTFAYTDAFLSPITGGGAALIGSTEVVDNISINSIPEPGTAMLLGTGLLFFGLSGRGSRGARGGQAAS